MVVTALTGLESIEMVVVNNLIDNNVVKFNEIGGVAAVFLKSRFFGEMP